MRILVIDDERKLVRAIKQLFVENHYVVDVAYDGTSGLDLARNGVYDVLVVDVMLPGMTGYDLVETLRKERFSVPILMLTARDGVDDRVYGLDRGADDYLVKPFASNELLARVRALTRRKGEVMGADGVQVGDLHLDLVTRHVTVGHTAVPLTAKEFQLLELFIRHPDQVLPKELLLDRVWGYEASVDTNAVEIYVHFLRKKLQIAKESAVDKENPPHIPTIETVRGVGYVLKGI